MGTGLELVGDHWMVSGYTSASVVAALRTGYDEIRQKLSRLPGLAEFFGIWDADPCRPSHTDAAAVAWPARHQTHR